MTKIKPSKLRLLHKSRPRLNVYLTNFVPTGLRLLTMLLPGRIYIALGFWHLGDFRNIFLPNIGEDQKKPYDLSAGPLSGTASYYGKFGAD